MVKNAIAYVSRKKNRTLIVFIILTVVLSCLYACLCITKSSDNLEKSLYKSSNSSVSITKKSANGYFDMNQFKNIQGIKEIQEIVPQYVGLAKPTKAKVVESEQKIKREDLSKDLKNVVSIIRKEMFYSAVESSRLKKAEVLRKMIEIRFWYMRNLPRKII